MLRLSEHQTTRSSRNAFFPNGRHATTTLFILLFLISHNAARITVRAQSASATLSGTVTDPNGDVIPGVNISVINLAQGFQRSATTNTQGTFVVPLLPPGTYITKAEREGFTTVEVRDLVLNVNDQVSLKIELKVGNLQGVTLDIVDTPSLIDQSPAVSTVVDRQFVENLPLNGRSFQSLISLTNGVVLTKTSVTAQGQFSVNGQRANANYFMVDGVSANIGASASTAPGQSGAGSLPALSASGGTNNLVSVDALQEFKLQTSTYAAEFGRTPGAQISIVTRSGTDTFHGTIFDYFRNEVFDANDWFANANRQRKPPLRQNDFGGVLGGPLFLPRFGEGGPAFISGKDRAFFFFSYEGLRLRQPLVGLSDVPSLAAREAASPAIRPFVNLYPLPNGPNKANGLASFNSSFSNPTSLDATSIRVDGTVNSKLTLFGRYNHAPSETAARGGLIQTLNTLTYFKGKTQTLTVGATLFFNSKITNDLRANYSRTTASSFFRLDDFGGAVVPTDSVLFSSSQSGATSQFSLALSGVPNGTAFLGRAPESVQRQFNVVDSLSVVKDSHQLKFGVDYRRLAPIFNAPQYSQGLVFSGVGNPTAPPAGTLLSGRLNFGSVASQISPQVAIFNNLSLYVQDTWRAASSLTLSYGLRWECVPPPHGIDGSNPIAVTQVDDLPNMSIAPSGTALWKTTYGNFAPRVGVSYQIANKPGWETVVRGGFGLFYDLGDGQASNAFAFAYPFTASKTLLGTPFPLSSSDATAPVVGPAPTSSDFLFVFDPELELPLVYQWNLSAEQSLGGNQSITASYVAAVGRRLLRMVTLRSPSPTVAGNVSITRNDATSDYHALQVQFQRRLSRGFQALASYAWAHSIDIASGDQLAGTPAVLSDPQRDRGPSDFDVRHAFNAALTYNLPTFGAEEIIRKILSGWAIDSIFTARSSTPVNVTYAATAPFGSIALRPDLVPGIPLYLSDPTVPRGRRFNNTRVTVPGNPNPQIGPFLRPTTLRQGTLGRNALRGFSVWQLDLGMRRQFGLGEKSTLQFKAEVFNLFNHPNFGDPVGTLTSSTFGVSTVMLGRSLGTGGLTGGFNPLYQVGGPRSMQFSLRFEF
jgi:hypothetical protein